MYPCSEAFHEAVRNRNPQKALLIFPDRVFTNEDINVDKGIEFRDYFNMEEDLSIGQTLSNEISFGLFNDDRLLNDYEFGEFLATIGVLTRTDRYSQRGIATVTVGNDVYLTDSRMPFIKKNNVAMATQPTQQIRSMLAYDGRLYCFGKDEAYYIVYDLTTGNVVSGVAVNAFMLRKAHMFWQGKGMHYYDHTVNGTVIHQLDTWKSGKKEVYEFVPLGWFTADRPKAPDQIQLDMTCNDFMVKFDEDWNGKTPVNIRFGNQTTVSILYAALCDAILGSGKYRVPDPFINGDIVIRGEPDEFKSATKRDVLKWIAEAACSNARIDRDGYMVLDWVRSTEQTFDATGYGEFQPYWYETKTIDKVYNRSSSSGDKTFGTGNEGYLILDNPFLKGVS